VRADQGITLATSVRCQLTDSQLSKYRHFWNFEVKLRPSSILFEMQNLRCLPAREAYGTSVARLHGYQEAFGEHNAFRFGFWRYEVCI
jgi:hypothetical protein